MPGQGTGHREKGQGKGHGAQAATASMANPGIRRSKRLPRSPQHFSRPEALGPCASLLWPLELATGTVFVNPQRGHAIARVQVDEAGIQMQPGDVDARVVGRDRIAIDRHDPAVRTHTLVTRAGASGAVCTVAPSRA